MGNPNLTQIEKLMKLPDPMLQFKWVAKRLPFDLPSEYMESIDLPFNNIAVSEGVFSAAKFIYYAGTQSINAFSASFYEDRYGKTLKWLQQWKALIRNPESGAYGLPSKYKQNMEVMMLDQKNNSIFTAKLIGVWPSDTSPMTLNYTDGSGRIVHQQSFSVDDIVITHHV